MRRYVVLLFVLLTGCASTLRTEVTTFHQWPADVKDETFVFARTEAQSQDLPYHHVESLVRGELLRLGWQEAGAKDKATLRVTLHYRLEEREQRVLETVFIDSWYRTPWYGPNVFPHWAAGPGGVYPVYGPMWLGMPMATTQERRIQLFHRELHIKIDKLAGTQPLLDVTVTSDGKEGNLAKVIPYLVKSAFADFPGTSGVARVIEYKLKE